ncbi:unnamed protein product [Acanthosepion pharaonis]|uniref:Uncharacterized protein n=1 Tax=Acanthosepion pharaonis TaxID=158019 RepID=A0A812ARJ8_ACAPH|nr:unnamed protein product [Sepia pharaonis]
MLSVGDGITDNILKENLKDTACLLVDETRDTFDTTSASQTANSGLGDTLDAISEHLPRSLSLSLSLSLCLSVCLSVCLSEWVQLSLNPNVCLSLSLSLSLSLYLSIYLSIFYTAICQWLSFKKYIHLSLNSYAFFSLLPSPLSFSLIQQYANV